MRTGRCAGSPPRGGGPGVVQKKRGVPPKGEWSNIQQNLRREKCACAWGRCVKRTLCPSVDLNEPLCGDLSPPSPSRLCSTSGEFVYAILPRPLTTHLCKQARSIIKRSSPRGGQQRSRISPLLTRLPFCFFAYFSLRRNFKTADEFFKIVAFHVSLSPIADPNIWPGYLPHQESKPFRINIM